MPASKPSDLHFPKAGIDVSRPAGEWPVRWGPNNEKHYTCPDAVNVRGFDAVAHRHRGGSRPGLSKFISTPLVASFIVQQLDVLVGAGYNPPGGGVQSTLSGRVVTVVAVAAGNVYVANPGDTTWTSPTNSAANSPPLNVSGVMQSAPNQQKLWFADGLTDRVYYDPSTNVVDDWTTSAGTMPESGGLGPRLICLWRGRTCQSGLFGDPQNIFMSKVDDPRDYDYSPANPSATDAVALNLSDLGIIGDVVTGLVPATDDVLVVLCDHTIYRIVGDPLAGGKRLLVCEGIGGAWGQAWCKDPAGNIYFFSNVPGVYVMPPQGAGQPVRISLPVDPLIRDTDTGNSVIRLFWDDLAGGFWLFITPSDAVASDPDSVTHWFYEVPRPDGSGGAWFKARFANANHNPICGVTVDGNEADDRTLVFGGWDGYVRQSDPDAADDDGTEIESSVTLGPYLTPNLDEVRMESMQGVFAEDSADVDYAILTGKTAEAALAAADPTAGPKVGTFGPSRGYTKRVNRAAHAVYVKLSSVGQWAMESIRVTMASVFSRKRARGKR